MTEGLAKLDALAVEHPDDESVANARAHLFASHMKPEQALQVATALNQRFPASYRWRCALSQRLREAWPGRGS